MTTRREIIAFIGALPILSLAGCGQGDTAANCQPIVLGDARACALCGMTINNFPGPKGQACLGGDETLGFCSHERPVFMGLATRLQATDRGALRP